MKSIHKHILIFISIGLLIFSCESKKDKIDENRIFGTWKEDSSYFHLKADTLPNEKINFAFDSGDLATELFNINDTLENWSFIRIRSNDTLEYINFPSPSIDGKYQYVFKANELNVSGQIYTVKDLNDSIMTLITTNSELVSVYKYIKVNPTHATRAYYDKEMSRINSIRKAKEDSIRALFYNLPTPDISASYPSGIESFYRSFYSKIEYPIESRIAGTEGKVMLGFMINEDGDVVNVTIMESLSTNCDKASIDALAAISQQTKWTPAMKNGKPIIQAFFVPVIFKLNE